MLLVEEVSRAVEPPLMYEDRYGPPIQRSQHEVALLDLDFIHEFGPLPMPKRDGNHMYPVGNMLALFESVCDF